MAHTTGASGRTISWLGNSLLLAWLAYLLIAPTIGFNWLASWHNEQRAAQIVLLAYSSAAFVPIAIAWSLLGARADLKPWFPWWLVAVFAFGTVSALSSSHAFAGLAELSLHILLAMLTLTTALVVALDVERAQRWARWFALLFSSAYVLGVATRYLAAVNLDRSIDLDVLILGYANPRFPSAFHTLVIPFLTAAAAERHERSWLRIAAFASLCLLLAINLGLGTRGIWFALSIGLPLSVILLRWSTVERFAVTLGLSCVVGTVLYLVLFRLGPGIAGSGSAIASPLENLTTVTSRDVLWDLSWQAIRSSPWLGIGPMQFAAFDSPVGAHPHNWLLQIGSEWGLAALAALLWGLYVLARAIRLASDRALLAAPVMAVCTALALGLVDGNLVMPVSQAGFFLVLGLLVGTVAASNEALRPSATSRTLLVPASALGAAAAMLVCFHAIESHGSQPTETSRFHSMHPGMWVVPRFWEQGLLPPGIAPTTSRP